VQPGDQDPHERQHAKNNKRVVEPQSATHIDTHQNACSFEQVFGHKAVRRHNGITALFLTGALLLGGCLPDPHTAQLVDLFDRLVSSRAMLGDQPPRAAEACDAIGEVQNRLDGEPGLVNVRPAWPALRSSTEALEAVCGLTSLLSAPTTNDSPALSEARQRWHNGIQRELSVACDHLRDAAVALGRARPC
jgi:hypothetical protein